MGYSVQTGITAAGTNQGNATGLTRTLNEVTSVASGTGVVLFKPPFGEECIVINVGANNLNVYPAVGGQINTLGTNIPLVVLAGSSARFVSTSASPTGNAHQWYAIP